MAQFIVNFIFGMMVFVVAVPVLWGMCFLLGTVWLSMFRTFRDLWELWND